MPDHVYAYTAWMKKRLEGRDITLIGHIKSKTSGRNNFQCSNGHQWHYTVAEGEAKRTCPEYLQVLPDTLKIGMPNFSFGGFRAVLNLGHQFRLYPDRTCAIFLP